MTTVHGENVLPVAFGGMLIENIAVGQRVAVLSSFVDQVTVFHLAGIEQRRQLRNQLGR